MSRSGKGEARVGERRGRRRGRRGVEATTCERRGRGEAMGDKEERQQQERDRRGGEAIAAKRQEGEGEVSCLS
jgi:hypothetical protein